MKRLIYTMLILAMGWSTGMATDNFPTFCNEWNVAEQKSGIYQTFKWRLTSDTVINAQKYVKIEKKHHYEGALREDDDANIYFVPADSTKEFLLYAFHVQVGDTLTNIWVSSRINSYYDIRKATITDISSKDPQVISVDIEYIFPESNNVEKWTIFWIAGIGQFPGNPTDNEACFGCIHSLEPKKMILCAYKGGKQVYISDFAETFGCEYNMQDDTHEGYYSPSSDLPSASKFIRDGQLFIKCDDKIFNAQGTDIN